MLSLEDRKTHPEELNFFNWENIWTYDYPTSTKDRKWIDAQDENDVGDWLPKEEINDWI
jgi:hypothetical protein